MFLDCLQFFWILKSRICLACKRVISWNMARLFYECYVYICCVFVCMNNYIFIGLLIYTTS